MKTRGVIYVARGAGYLDLARTSAESLRRVEPDLAIDLFTDQPVADGPFQQVNPLPVGGTRDKIAGMRRTRFDQTLFLDCDTWVLQPVSDVFGLLARFELAVAHDVRRASALVQEDCGEIALPYAFPQLNTGVLLYNRSDRMLAFLDAWARAHALSGRPRDQITFRKLLWQSDLRFHVLPPEYNLRRMTMLDAWEPLDARPVIVHSHRLLQHLRGGGERVADPARLLDLERLAHAEEWQRLGLAPLAAPGEDPLARLALAQARSPLAAPGLPGDEGNPGPAKADPAGAALTQPAAVEPAAVPPAPVQPAPVQSAPVQSGPAPAGGPVQSRSARASRSA